MGKIVKKHRDLYINDEGLLYSQSGVTPIAHIPSPNYTKRVKMIPELTVLHWTAGISARPALNWFRNPKSKVSAHFVIDRQGRITQCVSTDRRSYHAGRSSWRGRKSCNGFSIGIELVNPGPVTKIDADTVRLRNKKLHKKEDFMDAGEPFLYEENDKTYLRYTNKQMAALREVMMAITRKYEILDVAGHQDIAPKRKIDPGPELSYERIQQLKRDSWREFTNRDEALDHIARARIPKTTGQLLIRKVLGLIGIIPEWFSGVNRNDRQEKDSEIA